jgi:hypothetical protein
MTKFLLLATAVVFATEGEFGRLADFLVEDILEASDEDILAEAVADGEDPEAIAAAMRALFEKVDREFMGKHNGDAKRDAPRPGQSDVKLPSP